MKPRLKMMGGAWFCRSRHGGPFCFGLGKTPREAYFEWRVRLDKERRDTFGFRPARTG